MPSFGEARRRSLKEEEVVEAVGTEVRWTMSHGMALWLVVAGSALATASAKKASRPHIVFILADDMGWADTSLYGSRQIPTPNLDSLASTGVLLRNYYTQHECTPSRASLLTGLFPIHHGLHDALICAAKGGLPLDFKIMPQHFKDLGYETHIVGKWHMGYESLDYTPTKRGFDSFLGYYNGFNDYYEHVLEWDGHTGLDFWNNTKPLKLNNHTYATTRYRKRAESIIERRDKSKPLFLFMSNQATHSADEPEVLQAPEENVAKFSYIGNENRAVYAGMADALDQQVGALVEALYDAGMLENTVLVFSSDNGAQPYGFGTPNSGFNWPLRGSKSSLWEGAMRCAALVWSPLLQNSPRVSSELIHISDWLPTLYSAAGGDVRALGKLDGVDMWPTISKGGASPRNELLHDIHPVTGRAALRDGDYKLVIGSYGDTLDNRSRVAGRNRPRDDLDQLQSRSRTAAVLRRFYGDSSLFKHGHESTWRRKAAVNCGRDSASNFVSGQQYYLFNVTKDPCELHNLADKLPSVVSSMLKKLSVYNATAVPAIPNESDPRGFPENNNGIWAPWLS